MEKVPAEAAPPAEPAGPTGDPLVDDHALRSLGYAGRIARLVSPLLTGGSRYLAYTSDVGESFRPVISLQVRPTPPSCACPIRTGLTAPPPVQLFF